MLCLELGAMDTTWAVKYDSELLPLEVPQGVKGDGVKTHFLETEGPPRSPVLVLFDEADSEFSKPLFLKAHRQRDPLLFLGYPGSNME